VNILNIEVGKSVEEALLKKEKVINGERKRNRNTSKTTIRAATLSKSLGSAT